MQNRHKMMIDRLFEAYSLTEYGEMQKNKISRFWGLWPDIHIRAYWVKSSNLSNFWHILTNIYRRMLVEGSLEAYCLGQTKIIPCFPSPRASVLGGAWQFFFSEPYFLIPNIYFIHFYTILSIVKTAFSNIRSWSSVYYEDMKWCHTEVFNRPRRPQCICLLIWCGPAK